MAKFIDSLPSKLREDVLMGGGRPGEVGGAFSHRGGPRCNYIPTLALAAQYSRDLASLEQECVNKNSSAPEVFAGSVNNTLEEGFVIVILTRKAKMMKIKRAALFMGGVHE